MNRQFHVDNRVKIYQKMGENSILVLFAGEEIRKTADEYYPFFANRNFVYMTGIEQKNSVLLAVKDAEGAVRESLYVLPSDFLAERWTGRRLTAAEAERLSGVSDVRDADCFMEEFHKLAVSGNYAAVFLDLFRVSPADIERSSHRFRRRMTSDYPYLAIRDASSLIRGLRTIKTPEEIEAMRKAEEITGAGILAMMKASKPGMYEYQYKAEFDHAIGQYGPQGPGFPSIISAGANNFCIHYYSYTGQARDGDMVLNDVGAQYDNHITDVSRGFPCNGRFTERQKLLFNCMLETSNHMFSIIRPGMKMEDVDGTIRRFNAERLVDAGVMKSVDEVGTYMWHGGAHHVGYDTHDEIMRPDVLEPGMVFCIDVGIYHEEWGIGFRLEDNCLVTSCGCENLSSAIPRTVEDIESVMIVRR